LILVKTIPHNVTALKKGMRITTLLKQILSNIRHNYAKNSKNLDTATTDKSASSPTGQNNSFIFQPKSILDRENAMAFGKTDIAYMELDANSVTAMYKTRI
jgi:hypothetical protein